MKWVLKIVKWSFVIGVSVIGLVAISYLWVHQSSRGKIYRSTDKIEAKYTGILLGSLVFGENTLSGTTQLRADKAVDLHRNGKIKRILVSGDHGQTDYDEVNAIKNYLLSQGIPKSDIFMDHAGFDTYDSMVRAKKVFMVEDVIIISQAFHLPRAVFIANAIGLNAEGAVAADSPHLSLKYMENREILARVKAFLEVVFHVSPKYLGDEIPITGSSELTYD